MGDDGRIGMGDVSDLSGLVGRRVLITRPLPEGESTARLIQRHGGVVQLTPVMRVAPPDDPQPFFTGLANLGLYQGIVFTSAHGARAFLEHVPTPCQIAKIYAVGEKTAVPLLHAGLTPTVPDHPVGSLELAQDILQGSVPGDRFLFVRAQEGRDDLITTLVREGRLVDRVAAYKMAPIPFFDQQTLDLLLEGRIDAIPFFSGRSAQVFFNLLPAAQRQSSLEKTVLAALSPATARAMQSVGMRVDVISPRPYVEAMLVSLAQTLAALAG
ncbi:MAG: uroporphyrinogen-III synthase [Magnetococcales bacterium]|nr:uroporphyrinogen-III synthase [Magnetococcales bacterium]